MAPTPTTPPCKWNRCQGCRACTERMTDYELQCAHRRAWICAMPEQRMYRAELRRRGVAELAL